MLGHPYDAKEKKDVTPPKVLHLSQPPYTHAAHEARLQGDTVWGIVIGANGRFKDEMIIQPLGMGLDEQAAQALRTWISTPAARAGKPISVPVLLEIHLEMAY